VDGLKADTTVEQMRLKMREAFPEADASGFKMRLFFNGKEVKNLSAEIRSLGIGSGATVQVMFSSEQGSAAAAVPAAAQKEVARAAEPAGSSAGGTHPSSSSSSKALPLSTEPISVRAQGTLGGVPTTHLLEGLSTTSTVAELQERVSQAFSPGDDVRPRLFFMGKELKDGNAALGHAGLKPGTTSVQVMFAAGQPRSGSAANAAALAAAAGVVGTSQQADTGNAVMQAAEAAGLNTTLFQGGSSQAAGAGLEDASPEAAWRAMAALEEQLARENVMSEEASVRQASGILRQMLTTATHADNPALMQFAKGALPDLGKIWNFGPTREHLTGLLAMKAAQGVQAGSSSSSS